jgi:hypothetical protein
MLLAKVIVRSKNVQKGHIPAVFQNQELYFKHIRSIAVTFTCLAIVWPIPLQLSYQSEFSLQTLKHQDTNFTIRHKNLKQTTNIARRKCEQLLLRHTCWIRIIQFYFVIGIYGKLKKRVINAFELRPQSVMYRMSHSQDYNIFFSVRI